MSLYDTDFFQWTQEQAALLRSGRLEALELLHIADELEAMGSRERRELVHRLEELLKHLLKWRYQAGLRSPSWEISITKQRDAIEDLLSDNPSLRHRLDPVTVKAYNRAQRYAAKETGLPVSHFPEICPFSVEQTLDSDYWPEAAG